MSSYTYVYARTLAEVLKILSEEKDVRISAGGTDILPRLRRGLEKPGVLLDISRTELNYINMGENGFRIGASTLIISLEKDKNANL
jgi:xanthine dehydrogenase YagS FAD-binding subunit